MQGSEVENIKMVHKEKERELSVAFTKIDALTRQLEELQKGNTVNSYSMNGYKHAAELDKLRQELLVSTRRSFSTPALTHTWLAFAA